MNTTDTPPAGSKPERYAQLFRRLDALCTGEQDAIAIMATVASELFHAFEDFDWVGFYRNVGGELLKIGPYQGGHGCLTIPFARGVCGQCARERRLQNVPDVRVIPHHIACSSSTISEIVVPIFDSAGALLAVLDVDSDRPAAFDKTDETNLTLINRYFAPVAAGASP